MDLSVLDSVIFVITCIRKAVKFFYYLYKHPLLELFKEHALYFLLRCFSCFYINIYMYIIIIIDH